MVIRTEEQWNGNERRKHDIDVFINYNWVVTWWQYTFTHKTIHRTTQITTEQHK